MDRSASLDEIRQAFKRRALQVHPDKGGTAEAFHLVYQALETFADPEQRQRHNHRLAGVPTPPAKRGSEGKGSEKAKEKAKEQGKEVGKAAVSKLLMKIQSLLKQLPRHLRLEAIQQEFSQQQRVLLEQWIVESKETNDQQEPNPPKPEGSGNTLALTTNFRSVRPVEPFAKSVRRTGATAIKGISPAGSGRCYRAVVFFHGIYVYTKYCDLPTSLDFLVILTATKQKMLDRCNLEGTFEERMEKALTSSATEQERTVEELSLSFYLTQHAGFFIGSKKMRSPVVKCLNKLQKLRCCMDPLCGFCKYWHGKRNLFWYFTPVELRDLWEQLQRAQAEMCCLAGACSETQLRRLRSWYNATEKTRQRHLQLWELGHMGAEDTCRHQSQHWRDKQLRTRFKRSGDPVKDCCIALTTQLQRWQGFLDRKRQSKEQKRRLQRERIRKQQMKLQRLQREALRKRMRDPNLTMDDILGHSWKKIR